MRRARFRAANAPATPRVFRRANGERIRDVKHSLASAYSRPGISDFCFHDLRHIGAA